MNAARLTQLREAVLEALEQRFDELLAGGDGVARVLAGVGERTRATPAELIEASQRDPELAAGIARITERVRAFAEGVNEDARDLAAAVRVLRDAEARVAMIRTLAPDLALLEAIDRLPPGEDTAELRQCATAALLIVRRVNEARNVQRRLRARRAPRLGWGWGG